MSNKTLTKSLNIMQEVTKVDKDGQRSLVYTTEEVTEEVIEFLAIRSIKVTVDGDKATLVW